MDGGFTQLLRNEVSYSNLYTFWQRPSLLSVQFLKKNFYFLFLRTSSTILFHSCSCVFFTSIWIFKNYFSGKLVNFIGECMYIIS